MSARAELYARTHRGNPGDLAFYGRLCRGAGRVLELGSGYGRVLGALARSRGQLLGIERDPELLRLARRTLRGLSVAKRRAVLLRRGDIRDFRFDEQFERVILPYNTLYCLLSPRDALGCLRAVRRALEPGGVFAFDVWNAAPFAKSERRLSTNERRPVASVHYARRDYDVFERARVRRARQRLDVTYEYRPRAGGTVHRIAIPQRYYLADELDDLLARAGLRVLVRYGDFGGSPFTARSAQQIVLAGVVGVSPLLSGASLRPLK